MWAAARPGGLVKRAAIALAAGSFSCGSPPLFMWYKKTALTQRYLCARADTDRSVVPPCLPRRYSAATLQGTDIPLPGNGGCRQRILWPQPFPRALSEPLCCTALRPVPSLGGSLWLRLQFYFRFTGLKHLYHTGARLSTPCAKFFTSPGRRSPAWRAAARRCRGPAPAVSARHRSRRRRVRAAAGRLRQRGSRRRPAPAGRRDRG